MSKDPEEPAPFGTWRGLYAGLVVVLIAQVLIFLWLTQHFG